MEKILKKVYDSEKITFALKILSDISVLSSGVGFILLFTSCLRQSLLSSLKILLILGFPFFAVTILRALINAKRPYELYDFYERKPKKKSGRSFPSRHAYSSFVISSALVFIQPIFGGVLVFLGLLLCACRVLLGIHFIRDVLAGALIGIISAVLGIFILAPF